MEINYEVKEESNTIELTLRGRFDLNSYKDFINSYSKFSLKKKFIINLELDYMDSSSLGALLMFREHFGNHNDTILRTSKQDVVDILKVSNFTTLFKLEIM